MYGCAQENEVEYTATAVLEHVSVDLDAFITFIFFLVFFDVTVDPSATDEHTTTARDPITTAASSSGPSTTTSTTSDDTAAASSAAYLNCQFTTFPAPSAPLPGQLPPLSSSSSLPVIPVLPPSVPGTSQTGATAVPTSSAEAPPATLSDASPSPTSNPVVGTPPVGLNPGTAAGEAGNNANIPSSSDPAAPAITGFGGVANPVVIASSVVGAVAIVGLVGFLLWFWRKRWLRKRRSTLLTPLSIDPSFRQGEKPYVFDRESLGPTPRYAKLKAALGYIFKRFRGQVGGLISRNRDSTSTGNRSQFRNISQHSRNNSSLSCNASPHDLVTTKDRLKDWWERLTADMKFNWLLRGDGSNDQDQSASARNINERKAPTDGQPDFLTLLGMDEREVDREARRRRVSSGKDSAGSADHFLGGLGLDFDNASANPFADVNALSHNSAKPAPLSVVHPSNNPFSDVNAISAPAATAKPPTTYVADVRRSRGASVGGVTTRPPSGSTFSPRLVSMYRDSMQSVESFSTRRNKFRSDPFDLERPELLGSRSNPASSNYSQVGGTAPRLPGSAHTRAESFSSKYSSGVSLDGWSDPGPDVGSSVAPSTAYRYGAGVDSPVAGYRFGEQPKAGRRPSHGSQNSGNSVGKAL
ncbi:hypothetical protein Cob_v005426 [Colletotrichum orbiculare MAFF 240422]|uniref:Uncharacterized protein n=1 Tax=Colletotrichum orbiculare (strain 104-T / ATCC 96160 / CBS 514.97 / LARS 414 / MAFF 240422) TaxID=1213857 RepID=A0A484FVD3_COLOR|nr:hypothetical protein Cob_v005426 [Colletotrichum orbiculare MAFF 240422]